VAGPPPDDIAVVRHFIEAFNRRDLDAAMETVHPDATFVPVPLYVPAGTVYRGRAGVQSLIEAVLAQTPGLRLERREIRSLGDRLLVRSSLIEDPEHPSGKTVNSAALYQVAEGRIVRAEAFQTEAEAYEASERLTADDLEAAFEEAPAAIVLLDDEGRFRGANAAACALFGTDLDGLRGRSMLEFVPADWMGAVEEFWRAVGSQGQLTGEFPVVSDAGVRHAAVEFRAKAGLVAGQHLTVLIARDDEPAARAAEEPRLTAREREVFRLLALGMTAREAAHSLGIAPDTVRTHVRNAIVKLEAKTRVQAIALALTRGEVDLSDPGE
jgi:PAS domain S-box-containing protein